MDNPFIDIRFSLSAMSSTQLPTDDGAEVAFAGRSNAGKSSAINVITGRKSLARTSKTPGRTRAINIFAIDDHHRLVDLPGFGYARLPRALRQQWEHTWGRYLQTRRSLRGLILVIDIRRQLGTYDQQVVTCCDGRALPLHILLSKCDKLTRAQSTAALRAVEQHLAEFSPRVSVQLFSASQREGVISARAVLAQWLGLAPLDQKKAPANKGREPGA
ncbi:MAG: ribosome biogenesis GTP-binding protein YihA/YsxC [Acidiferrobacterales bacterium]